MSSWLLNQPGDFSTAGNGARPKEDDTSLAILFRKGRATPALAIGDARDGLRVDRLYRHRQHFIVFSVETNDVRTENN